MLSARCHQMALACEDRTDTMSGHASLVWVSVYCDATLSSRCRVHNRAMSDTSFPFAQPQTRASMCNPHVELNSQFQQEINDWLTFANKHKQSNYAPLLVMQLS